jgi:hypothetical protein
MQIWEVWGGLSGITCGAVLPHARLGNAAVYTESISVTLSLLSFNNRESKRNDIVGFRGNSTLALQLAGLRRVVPTENVWGDI